MDLGFLRDEQFWKDYGKTLAGAGEMAAMVGSGAIGEIAGGLGGIQSLAMGRGSDQATKDINTIQDKLTYAPRTETAQGWLQNAAPYVNKGANIANDIAMAIEGSTGIAREAVKAVPQMALELLPSGVALKALNKIPSIPMKPNFKQAGTLAGRKSKTLNPKTVAMAESMRDAGKSRDEIWKATGDKYGQPATFDPVDGSFRYEIDDSGVSVSSEAQDYFSRNGLIDESDYAKIPVGDVISGDLMDAYDLGKIDFSGGIKNELDSLLTGNTATKGSFIGGQFPKLMAKGDNVNDLKSTGLHELNHAVQGEEGFARGGSPEMFQGNEDIRKLKIGQREQHFDEFGYSDWEAQLGLDNPEKYSKLLEDFGKGNKNAFYDEFAKDLPKDMQEYFSNQAVRFDDDIEGLQSKFTPLEQYQRLLGEADSRGVQKRMDYSMQERIDKPFWQDYDVPEDELIRQYGSDVAKSIKEAPKRNAPSGIGKKQSPAELRAEANAQKGILGDQSEYLKEKAQELIDNPLGYRGAHLAPTPEGANTIDNLSDVYPDDVYGAKGLHYYGSGLTGEQDALTAMMQGRGDPEALLDIYRAVPKGVDKINAGDWVTPSRAYAESHGGSWVDNGDFDVLMEKIRAGDLTASGDALTEWGYHPAPNAPKKKR